MQIKKIMALVLSSVIICLSLSTQVYAEDLSPIIEEEIISPYEYAQIVYNSLNISSGTAECVSNCIGYSNVVQITVTQTLQKFWGLWVWNDVDTASWSDTSMSNGIDLSTHKSGLSSGTYRLKSVFELTASNGKTETITIYSSEKTKN
ncbi:MAG: hypothetical protein IJT36_00355 [Alphaproteobacteria bacterium]|nr:hypothetical protein [Alphaproteobacteria bacterium]